MVDVKKEASKDEAISKATGFLDTVDIMYIYGT